MVGLFAFEIGQFEVAPVVQSRSFGSGTGRQTPPVRSSLRLCRPLGGADNPWRLAPRSNPMIGIDAEYIAFTGLAEVPLDIADPIDAIARNPTERRASRKGALDHLDRKLRLGRKADVVRHRCVVQASRIVGPALRQIERPIDESMAVTRHVGSKNTDLTVRNFARRTSILPRYSARCLALLEKAGLIDHQHRVLVGKMLSDIVAHHIAQSIGI